MLKGDGFMLRKLRHSDAESLAKHANNRNIARFLRDGFPHPYRLSDAKSWISMVLEGKDIVYTIEVEGEACGGIGLHRMKDVYRFNAEIGYWLSEQHWGKGIVTEAVKLMVDEGFTREPFTRIYAGVFSNNKASMRVLEKCGFRQEAVFTRSVKKEGVYLDEHIYSILKENWKNMDQ